MSTLFRNLMHYCLVMQVPASPVSQYFCHPITLSIDSPLKIRIQQIGILFCYFTLFCFFFQVDILYQLIVGKIQNLGDGIFQQNPNDCILKSREQLKTFIRQKSWLIHFLYQIRISYHMNVCQNSPLQRSWSVVFSFKKKLIQVVKYL